MFVSDFRIHAHHLGMIERRNESEIMPGGRHVDVAARLVGLGFQGEAVSILLRDVVFAKIVDGFAQALDGLIGAAASVGFNPLAASPEDENLRAELGTEVHGAHGFLEGVGAHLGIVGCERTVAEDGMEKK